MDVDWVPPPWHTRLRWQWWAARKRVARAVYRVIAGHSVDIDVMDYQ